MTATALSFAAGTLAVLGLGLLAPVAGLRLRRPPRSGRPRRPAVGIVSSAMSALAAAGRRLSPAARLAASRDLEGRIAAAGLGTSASPAPGTLDGRDVMAAKLAAAALGAVAGLSLGNLAPGRLGITVTAAGPVAGFLAPDVWLARLARQRARQVRRELPAMLDLLRVTVEAGLPLTAAVAAVGERTRGTLGAEWRLVGREVALGVPLSRSLRGMSARVPTPEIAALIGALDRALRHGAPLADTLEAQARTARAARSRRIREEAARAGPKIQLVVALLLVPSVLLLVAAALVSALVGDGAGLALP